MVSKLFPVCSCFTNQTPHKALGHRMLVKSKKKFGQRFSQMKTELTHMKLYSANFFKNVPFFKNFTNVTKAFSSTHNKHNPTLKHFEIEIHVISKDTI